MKVKIVCVFNIERDSGSHDLNQLVVLRLILNFQREKRNILIK